MPSRLKKNHWENAARAGDRHFGLKMDRLVDGGRSTIDEL